jgi:shikimate kinase
MEARRHLYDEVATVRIDTAGKSADEVADEVVTLTQLR